MFNTLFLICVEFDEKWFRSFKSSDFYFLFVFKFKNLSAKCFWIFWKCSFASHEIKTALELVFCKISRFFEIQNFFHYFDRSKLFLNQSKYPFFRPKLFAWFDSCLIDARLIEIIKCTLLIAAQFLSTNQNSEISNS